MSKQTNFGYIQPLNETPDNNPYNILMGNQLYFRGQILELTVKIERKIDDYLSSYFCETLKKKNQINELLFFTEKISLDIKRQVFVSLLKSNSSDYIKKNPEFLKYMEEIVPHRNIFAHLEVISIYDLPVEDRKKLVFKKYTNGVLKPKKYTVNDIVDLQVKMEYVNFSMGVILQELPPLT